MSAKPRKGDHNLDERKPRAVQQSQPRHSRGREHSREVKLATKVPRKKRYNKFKGKNDDPSFARKRVKQSNDLRDQSSRTKSNLAKATPEENPQPTRRVSTSVEIAKPRQLTILSDQPRAFVWFFLIILGVRAWVAARFLQIQSVPYRIWNLERQTPPVTPLEIAFSGTNNSLSWLQFWLRIGGR
jgi:hypothetical protein